MKKVLSFILAFAMVLGLVPAISFATDEPLEIVVADIEKWDNGIVDGTITEADPGDTIVVTVGVKNNSNSTIELCGVSAYLTADAAIFTAQKTGKSPFKSSWYTKSGTTLTEEELDWSLTTGTPVEGVLALVGAGNADNAYELSPGETMTYAKVALTISDTAAKQDYVFSFYSEGSYKNGGSDSADNILSATTGTKTLTINGEEVTPAGDPLEIVVADIQKWDDGIVDGTITEADAGDKIVVTVGVKNNSNSAIELCGVSAYLTADSAIFTPEKTGKSPFKSAWYTKSGTTLTEEELDWSLTTGTPVSGVLAIVGAGNADNAYELEPGETMTYAKVALTISSEASAQDYEFGFYSEGSYKNGGSDSADNILSATTGTATLTINGAATPPDPEPPIEIVVTDIEKWDDGIVEGTITEADAGDKIVVTIGVKNNSSGAIELCGVSAYLTADSAIFTPEKTGKSPFKSAWYTKSGTTLTEEELDWSLTTGTPVSGVLAIVGAGNADNAYELEPGETMTYAKVALTISSEASAQDYEFGFYSEGSYKNGGSDSADNILSATTGTKTLTINGAAAPVIPLELGITNIQKWNNGAIEDAAITEATAGDIIVLTLGVKNVTAEPVEDVYGITSYIKADTSVFTAENPDESPFEGEIITNEGTTLNKWSCTGSATLGGEAISVITYGTKATHKRTIAAGETVTYAIIALKISETAEPQDYTFEYYSDATYVNNVGNYSEEYILNTTTTKTLTINAAPAVATTVEISGGQSAMTIPALTEAAVTGTAFTATVKDQYGETMTADVTWSIDPAYTGVSISADGKVTVDNTASVGGVTVKATSGTAFATTTVTLSKAASVATTVEISGGQSAMTIPALTEAAITGTAFTATVKDQYGETMTADVTWSIDPAYTGASISTDGKVTIDNTAAVGSVTVKATSGTASATTTVTLSKASSVATTVEISGGQSAMTIPALTEAAVTGTAFTATVKDQYGETMTASVTWSIDPAYTGASISTDGKVTIDNTAAVGGVTVKATSGTASATTTVTLSKASSVATTVEIADGQSSIILPAPGEAAVTGAAFTATVKDQYGETMTADVTWSIDPAKTGVSVTSGAVTVDDTASAGTVTVKATAGDAFATADVLLTRADSVATTLTISGGQSGMTLPALTESAITGTAFTATVKNQYGETMTASVTWSIDPAYTGATISDGAVTIDNTASVGTVTVKATSGTLSNTATVTISKATSVATTVTIADGQSAMTIPALTEAAVTGTAFTATVKDQYGETMTADVTWSIDPAYTGATISDGAVTIDNTASVGSVAVKAISGTAFATTTVTLSRASSVATTVEISGGQSAMTIPALTEAAVTGTAFTATVKDQYGETMTADVTWSIDPAYTGASISTDGKVTIDNTASVGTVTVKATSGTLSNTATVTISKATSVATTVEISGGQSAMTIPALTEAAVTGTAFTATVKDQYGETMTADVTWTIDPAYTGATISDGAVTIDNTASVGSVAVKAISGTAFATTTVTLSKAASVATTVEISGGQSAMTIPALTEAAVTGTAFTATVKDQYGETMTADVTWSIDPAYTGATISDGAVTIDNTASVGTVTVKATSGTLSNTATVTISKATSVATTVTIADGQSAMTIPALTEAAITGTAFIATVKDQYGETMTADVTWTIDPAYTGATISDGAVTIDNTASVGSVAVKAISGTAFATTTVTLSKASSVATTVEISGGQTEMAVPAKASSPATGTAFTATVKDQYGETMTADVTWTIDPAYTGATISDGAVTIDNTAAAGNVTVKATSGTVSATTTVTLSKASSVATTVEISGGQSAMAVPAKASSPATGTAFTATVKDQYGETMTADVTWTIDPAKTGVTISDGAVTIDNTAAAGTVTVKATAGTAFATTTVTVTKASPAATELVVYYGDAEAAATATYFVPATDASANTYEYTAKVYDQFGDEMTGAAVSWALENADDFVSVTAGTLSVLKGADTSKTYTLTASIGDTITDSVVITLTDIDITWATATVKSDPTYGDDWSQIVTLTGGSAKIGATPVPGTFELKETGKPSAGETNYTITFKSSDGLYTVDSAATTIEIAPKSITITWADTDLTYNGSAQKPTATATGLVGTDTLVITVSGEETHASTGYTATASITDGNYSITNPTQTFSIKAKDITLTWSNTSLTYNGSAQKPTATATGLAGTDTLDVTVSGEETNAGTGYTATASITDGNYAITNPEQTFSIDKKEVTVSGFTASDKVYDGTTEATLNATGVTVDGVIGEDEVTATATGAFENKNAGTGKKVTISGITLSGAAAGNYKPASEGNQTETSATVTALEVTVSGIKANDKYHNDTTEATLDYSSVVFTPAKAAGDDLTVTAKGEFEDAEIGADKTVTITDIELAGTDKDNYVLASTGNQTETTASIKKKSSGSSSAAVDTNSYYNKPVTATGTKGKISVPATPQKVGSTVTITVTPDDGYEVDEIKITTADGTEIPVTYIGNGQYTYVMPKADVSVDATYKEKGKTTFVDVEKGGYYEDAVSWAVEKGVTTGTSATTFSPDGICTRAQMVTFLWRAVGSPEPKGTTCAFTDLEKGAYYEKAVIWAYENGVAKGTSETTFSPELTVTRAQVVTFLYRYSGKTASVHNAFNDVSTSAYYASAVTWALQSGITTGTSATTFSPDAGCKRSQIVTFLYRFFND